MKKIIKFSKDGCVPCQLISNILNDQGIEYEEINALENEEMREKYEIQSVPVTILLDGDKVIDRVNGFNPVAIDSLLSKM